MMSDIIDATVEELMRPRKSNARSDKWYKKQSARGTYYTPFAPREDKLLIAGPGNRMPTPTEALDLLKDHPKAYPQGDGLWFVDEDAEAPPSNAIDLPAGAYVHRAGDHIDFERLVEVPLRDEPYVELSGVTKSAGDHIKEFLENKAIYESCGMHKLGMLLYGPPGNGKTLAVRQILRNSLPADAVVVYINEFPSVEFLKKIKTTLTNRLKVIIFEEMVTIVESMPIHKLLNFLDGEQSLDHCVIIGTTNYPENLPGNIVDRPSRFDVLYEIGDPDEEDRRRLLLHFMGTEPSADDIKRTEGLSIAGVKEVYLYGKLKNISLADSVKRLKAQSALAKKAFSKVKPMGFRVNPREFE